VTRIRALLVDMMGVLLYDPYLEALEAATGLATAHAHRLKDPTCWPEFEVGAIDEAEFARRFFGADAGARFDLEAFHSARRAGYRPLPGMQDLLVELDGQVERYLASNYPVWVEELRVRYGFDDYFEGVFASHHLRVRKPDPRFFELILAEIGHAPQHCLFIDDRPGNCAAAAALGMQTHVFTGAVGVRAKLAEADILASPD
jgi:FMN hydrolase / 5-amino-6-(5-phospho-D-ribitylamino)uracil phosphatase